MEDNLTRIGKIPLPEILPTKGSTKQQYYRNKLEFSFSNKSWLTYEQLQTEQEFDCRNALGFHIPCMFDKVLDIKKCWLQDDISNRIRLSIRQCAIDNHYPFFDLRGRDYIWESMEGLRFKIGPKSFYQTNSEQAYELYKVAREFAGLTGTELVYDLYTGTGTIANFVARQSRKVVGIEYVPEAIEDAKENARINGLDNTLFYAGDMKDILTEDFIEEHGRPEVIITDPPRAGMHDDVIKTILFASPERIVYVSCNPATQARDLSLLDAKYKVERVQPVDMFPHTHHVENVVLLVRKE